jgi:hypothetical protein
MSLARRRLETALWECDRQVEALKGALADWHNEKPADWTTIEQSSALVRILDQLLYRFTKLQDAIGSRMIPATLAVLSEPFEEWPMIDRLNRLERLGYLDTAAWMRWREVRNRLTHEYPDQAEHRAEALRLAVVAADNLLTCYQLWRAKLAHLA